MFHRPERVRVSATTPWDHPQTQEFLQAEYSLTWPENLGPVCTADVFAHSLFMVHTKE